MITVKDLYDIVGNKIANELQKSIIRTNFPPHIAERMCDVVDRHEASEHFQHLLKEYNDWMAQQQRQQQFIQQFLQQYYK